MSFLNIFSNFFLRFSKKEPPTSNNKVLIQSPSKENNIKEKTSVGSSPTPLSRDGNMSFEKALAFTLRWEGGYVNHPSDPGGETNKGIIKKEYDKYRTEKSLPLRSVKEIEDTEVKDIYENKYWKVGHCDVMRDKLAIVHFDTVVNTGITQGAKFLQRCLKVKDDGVIGAGTLKALADSNQDSLIPDYLAQRRAFYQKIVQVNPKLQVFLKGWMNRVDSLEKVVAA